MSVSKDDIQWFSTTNIPSDNTGTGGGPVNAGNQINDGNSGKIFTVTAAPADGETDAEYFGKVHAYNNNSSEDLINSTCYMMNLLKDPASSGVIKVTTTAAADNSGKHIRLICENSIGTPGNEDVPLPSVSPGSVYSTKQANAGRRIELELRDSSNNLVAAAGDIYIYDVDLNLLGMIPEGFKTATGMIDIGLAPALDDSETITNRLTPPTGITFTRAKDTDSEIAVANSGTLTHGKNQAVWIRWTLQDGKTPSPEMELGLTLDGDSA